MPGMASRPSSSSPSVPLSMSEERITTCCVDMLKSSFSFAFEVSEGRELGSEREIW